MSLLATLKGKGLSGFGYGSTAEEATQGLDLSGRAYLVTGANSGLGLETVRVLSLRGARVFAAARTRKRRGRRAARFGAKIFPRRLRIVRSRLRARLHRGRKGRRRPARRPHSQRRNHGPAEAPAGAWLRAAVLHQSYRPFLLATGLIDQSAEKGRVVAFRAPRISSRQKAASSSTIFPASAAIRPGAPMANRNSPIFSLRKRWRAASPEPAKPPMPSIPESS